MRSLLVIKICKNKWTDFIKAQRTVNLFATVDWINDLVFNWFFVLYKVIYNVNDFYYKHEVL